MSSSIVQIAIIIVYVLIMSGVGYWSMRRTRSVGDFFLGGRNLGPWMSAFAMFLPMIVVPVVSLMTEAPPRELVERAFHDPQENTGTFDEKEYKKAAHG
jgi:Na+/proline symporter